ncbi:MAG: hypothetical protein PVS3B3_34210 [Ktedonobacteraceae bacterium]
MCDGLSFCLMEHSYSLTIRPPGKNEGLQSIIVTVSTPLHY